MRFIIEIYVKENGRVPLKEFLNRLDPKTKAKVLRDLDILEKHGNSLTEPYSKHLRDGIYELRTIFGSNRARCLYFFFEGKTIVITHGFIKKQGKTPIKEIEKAIRYRDDWIRRHKDEI